MKFRYKIRLSLACMILGMSLAAAQTPYDEGQKALRESRWMAAAKHFEDAIDSEQADAAMYWRAHALYQAGHRGEAHRQVLELGREHPQSSWVEEARALQVEFGGGESDANAEDELRIVALSQLMNRDLERALPLVIELMRNTESDRARQDAMFVLGMSDSPQAQKIIAEAAHDDSDPQTQATAIGMLAAAGTDFSLSLLDGLYRQSMDKRVKQAVIHAYIAGDSPDPLVDILKTETDLSLRRELIYALGSMGGVEAIRGIYPTLDEAELRMAAIEAFAIAGDADMLSQILENETQPELRITAIHGIAIHGGAGAGQRIESLYDRAESLEEKMAILESLVIVDNAGGVALRVVNTETNPRLQELAVHVLGMLGETEELTTLYERFTDLSTRRAILEALAVAGDTDGIRIIMAAERDPELKTSAIHSLAVGGDEQSSEFLAGIYDEGTSSEKTAVIESLAALQDASALISIAKKEQDPDLRRLVFEVLSSMDSEEASEYLFQLFESDSG